MSSRQKHKERSRKTNNLVIFKSDDKAKHKIVGNVMVFSPKRKKESKFLEDREGGKQLIEAYEKGRESKVAKC